MKVTVIGTGYVGLITGACLAYLGHSVFCVDSDQSKIDILNSGGLPIYEPHLLELIALARRNGSLEYGAGMRGPIKDSEVIFIAVGTPPLPNGACDLGYVEAAAREIGACMDDTRLRVVVNKSTVPVGSGNLVEALVREGSLEHADRIRFTVASNPEFLREGVAIGDSLYPDRIVVGADDSRTLAIMQRLYKPLIEQTFDPPPFLPRPAHMEQVPLVPTSLTSAEMIKYSANAFLAMKISFANEMANICERVGAEIAEVAQGLGLDTRIGNRFLNAGIGWGGSCFGKDLQSLTHIANEYGYRPRLLEAAQEVNNHQRQLIIQKLQEKLFVLKGRTIGLLGLAFKPGTDDLRDAPSLTIAGRLLGMGARVRAYDPVAMAACRQLHPKLKVQYCDSVHAVANGADALVLVTEWDEFRNLELPAIARLMANPILIDGRNVIDPSRALQAGLDYVGIGHGVRLRRGSPRKRPSLVLDATA